LLLSFFLEKGDATGQFRKERAGFVTQGVYQRAGIYPVEIYSDERITSFREEDRMTPEHMKGRRMMAQRTRAWHKKEK